ncbi:MAG: hypothetical protein JWQ40_666 [Segetibacter sp.]|nr:hypothetical protein [Segetibacter sp.]
MAAYSQTDSLLKVSLVQKFEQPIADFTTDNLGNIYLLTGTNQVKKVNSKGDSIAVFNDVRRFGKIYSVDATNPLKVLVYYKDFATVAVLDRLLNVRNTIDLRKQNILQVTAVTSSYDNNIWLYDELDSKLKKIDDNGNLLLESTDFRQVFDAVPSPTNLYDRDGQLYLYDARQGLFVFDYYGGKKNNFAMLQLSDLQVIDKNTITARDSSRILLYKPATLQQFSFKPFTDQDRFTKINFNGSKIYCLTKDGQLEIYSVVQ